MGRPHTQGVGLEKFVVLCDKLRKKEQKVNFILLQENCIFNFVFCIFVVIHLCTACHIIEAVIRLHRDIMDSFEIKKAVLRTEQVYF